MQNPFTESPKPTKPDDPPSEGGEDEKPTRISNMPAQPARGLDIMVIGAGAGGLCLAHGPIPPYAGRLSSEVHP